MARNDALNVLDSAAQHLDADGRAVVLRRFFPPIMAHFGCLSMRDGNRDLRWCWEPSVMTGCVGACLTCSCSRATLLCPPCTDCRAFKRILDQVEGAGSSASSQPEKAPSAPAQRPGSGKSASAASEKSSTGKPHSILPCSLYLATRSTRLSRHWPPHTL